MTERVKFTIQMDLTVPQALAMQAMMEYVQHLSSVGSSRYVGFYFDGDGNFHPNMFMSSTPCIPPLTQELRNLAVVSDNEGDRMYDFDPIAWKLRDGEP